MRIRKRSQSVVVVAPQMHRPISCKYHEKQQLDEFVRPELAYPALGSAKGSAECSDMQEARRVRGDTTVQYHDSPQSSSDVFTEPPVLESLRVPDADLSRSLEHDATTDKARRASQSPTKRRKIEHECSFLFEGLSSMTAAELLAVNELANGVRLRLAASEQSTSEHATKTSSPVPRPSENSKDALISSIFYVFDTCGENGLSASEVVKFMLDQQLPGLKEGGARHTVQVANVLRSSSSFISLGDKKYLLCSTLDSRTDSVKKPTRVKTTSPDSMSHDSYTQNPKPRRGSSKSTTTATRSGNKKVQAEKPKVVPQGAAQEQEEEARQLGSSDGEEATEPVVVRVARRRGPSSSQKGKGPTQCKRYDGRGWQCSRLTEPGYSLCVHHQDLINKRAAKLKEQQTLSRLMESVNRKTKSQPAPTTTTTNASEPDTPVTKTDPENGTPTNLKLKIVLSSKDREKDSMHVQKRKMLSLMTIK